MKPAKRDDWNVLKPLPEKYTTLQLERHFTESEMQKIHVGFIPEQMEDKWVIYFEDDTLYLHRSWTGYCIYVAGFTQKGDMYAIKEFCVNREPSQYNQSDDAQDLLIFPQLIDNFLLR